MYSDQKYFTVSDVKYASESFVASLYEAECDHAFVGDELGHSSLACAKCGTPAGQREEHGETYSVSQIGKRTTFCAECGYVVKVELCDGFHWLSDADGHWENSCDICGTPAGAPVEHGTKMSEYIKDSSYSLGCEVCGYGYYTKTLPVTTTLFMGPVHWAKGAATYYQVNGGSKPGAVVYDGSSFPYASNKGNTVDAEKPIHGQILFNRSANDASGTSYAEQALMDVDNADYLIFKIRTNDNTQSMSLSFSTTGRNRSEGVSGIKSFSMPLSSFANGEWGIIVIDLAATFGDFYVKDAQTGTYIVDSFYFTMNGFMAK
jgi:hypothetical protein